MSIELKSNSRSLNLSVAAINTVYTCFEFLYGIARILIAFSFNFKVE